jgi:hypothetical protein
MVPIFFRLQSLDRWLIHATAVHEFRGFRKTPIRMTKAIWATVGLVGQASSVEPRNPATRRVVANLYAAAFFAWTCRRTTRRAYDYLTTPAKTTMPGIPKRFKGLSGGGLWQIALTMKKATGKLDWNPRFCGVILWDQPRPRNVLAITAHGPRSIFETAWKRWGLASAIRAAKARPKLPWVERTPSFE